MWILKCSSNSSAWADESFGKMTFCNRSSYRISHQCELLNAPARYLIGQTTLYKRSSWRFSRLCELLNIFVNQPPRQITSNTGSNFWDSGSTYIPVLSQFLRKWVDRAKDLAHLGHMEHTNCFSPVWTLTCICKLLEWGNSLYTWSKCRILNMSSNMFLQEIWLRKRLCTLGVTVE